MIAFLAMIPGAIAAAFLAQAPASKAFIYVALPTLVCIPTYYYLDLPALPDLNFFNFAILPIFAWWIIKGSGNYKITKMDLLVLLYVGLSLVSEFTNMGPKDGINLVINRTFQIIMPYLLMKHFFAKPELRIPMLKLLAMLGAVIAFLSLTQFKFDISLVNPLDYIWPEKLSWVSQARYGVVRVTATFTHAILAGLMWAFFAFFSIWLQKQKAWGHDIIGKLVIFWNVAGMFMTISRGPIIGFLIGLGVYIIGLSANRAQYFLMATLLAVLVVPPVTVKFVDYVSISRFDAKTETQENAIYRWELLENYIDVIKEAPYLGYGIQGRPVVNNQDSVDNQFLLIALLHGSVVMFLFMGMNLYMCLQMGSLAMRLPIEAAYGQLAWLLIGCAGTWFFTLATVWMGGQTEMMVFMLFAMSDALAHDRSITAFAFGTTIPEGIGLPAAPPIRFL